MIDKDYEEQVDTLFALIEDSIDELDADMDVDSTAGMLTIEFPDGSQAILSRQLGNHEVWVAAKSGGFHLSWAGNEWRCGTSGENLDALLNRVFSEQLGTDVKHFRL